MAVAAEDRKWVVIIENVSGELVVAVGRKVSIGERAFFVRRARLIREGRTNRVVLYLHEERLQGDGPELPMKLWVHIENSQSL